MQRVPAVAGYSMSTAIDHRVADRFHHSSEFSSTPPQHDHQESSSPRLDHRRGSSLQNLKKYVDEAIIMISPFSISSHVVSVLALDDKTKLIGLEIPKQAESIFENKQFVAVYNSDRRKKAVEASTFPIVNVRPNANGASVVYIVVRVDETHDPHSMATFLYEHGRPTLSAKLVL
jgi:hypothetical protein